MRLIANDMELDSRLFGEQIKLQLLPRRAALSSTNNIYNTTGGQYSTAILLSGGHCAVTVNLLE
jgi:hypothetical protein